MTSTWLTPEWPLPRGVHARVTTRNLAGHSQVPFETFNLGDRCGDDPAAVAANRQALSKLLGLPATPHWLRQVHGNTVHAVNHERRRDETPEADAAVTQIAGEVLGVLTADCLPVLFCSGDGRGIGVAHAGWRGLAGGVLEATVAQMHDAPDRILAWLGPAIGAASYEVGDDVRQALVDGNPRYAGAFVGARAGHWHCDLALLARWRLEALGLTRIHGGGFDTRTDPRFYSYRQTPNCGRFASLIWRD
jgi:YfiH family protein